MRVLAQVQRASPRAVARLVAGSLGYLLFSYKGALIGLRGIARINAETRPLMEFVVVDGAERPERRTADRVAMGTRVTIASLGSGAAGEPLSTFTVNISATGVLLKRPRGAPPTGDVALELFFGADPSPVPARGQIVRTTDDHLAVHFEDIDGGPADPPDAAAGRPSAQPSRRCVSNLTQRPPVRHINRCEGAT